MRENIRVLLVDDHAVLRAGLRLLLDREEGIEAVGEAGTAEEAVRSLARLGPDVVVIDIEMPGAGGIEGARAIRRQAPAVRILFLSMHDRARDVRRAFEAGADGYLLKSAADEDLVRAIRAVAAGERYVHPSLGAALAAPATDGPLAELTEREREVLRLLALGHTNHEIADSLTVSVRTIESHRAHIMAKLRVNTRAGLVRAALNAGLLTEPAAGTPQRPPGRHP
ncbi:MAG: response regulator transcription factor [Miltoncostaeaceae bacterium]